MFTVEGVAADTEVDDVPDATTNRVVVVVSVTEVEDTIKAGGADSVATPTAVTVDDGNIEDDDTTAAPEGSDAETFFADAFQITWQDADDMVFGMVSHQRRPSSSGFKTAKPGLNALPCSTRLKMKSAACALIVNA